MKVSELIRLLKTVDKNLEVVTRGGNNHGANIVVSIHHWVAKDNQNTHSSCDVLLPDSSALHDGYTKVLILQ